MANQQHLKIVLSGTKAIAEWLEVNQGTTFDLSGANLRRINLVQAKLNGANLSDTNLEWADMRWIDLKGANLSRSNLTKADLHKADLRGANLCNANLTMTNLEDSDLSDSIIDKTIFGFTRLINTSLYNVQGLKTAEHQNPSIVDKETIAKSGSLPKAFTRHLTSNTNSEAILTGYEFEREVEAIYICLGLKVERDVEIAGNQIDILLTEKTKTGVEIKTAVECKSSEKPIGKELVNRFSMISILLKNGKEIKKSIMVSKSGYTRYARNAAKMYNIELLDIADLRQMVERSLKSE